MLTRSRAPQDGFEIPAEGEEVVADELETF